MRGITLLCLLSLMIPLAANAGGTDDPEILGFWELEDQRAAAAREAAMAEIQTQPAVSAAPTNWVSSEEVEPVVVVPPAPVASIEEVAEAETPIGREGLYTPLAQRKGQDDEDGHSHYRGNLGRLVAFGLLDGH